MGDCNKIGYPTKAAAVEDSKAILIQNRNRQREKRPGKGNKKKFWPYECPQCGEWHLTSMSRQISRIYKRNKRKKELRDGARNQ